VLIPVKKLQLELARFAPGKVIGKAAGFSEKQANEWSAALKETAREIRAQTHR
jgi:hypothetical protein